MSEGFPFLDIIILAMVAGFIALRLRGVLGRRTGHERPPNEVQDRRRYEAEDPNENVVPLEPRTDPAARDSIGDGDGSPLEAVLTRLMVADRSFTIESFVEGAGAAYRMIVIAFAEGDSDTLKKLLSEQVYNDFNSAIENRAEHNQTASAEFEGDVKAEIVDAAFDGQTAQVTVEFVSHLVRATRDDDGVVIDGHPAIAREITDIWTFARDVSDRDPNWALISTRGAD